MIAHLRSCVAKETEIECIIHLLDKVTELVYMTDDEYEALDEEDRSIFPEAASADLLSRQALAEAARNTQEMDAE